MKGGQRKRREEDQIAGGVTRQIARICLQQSFQRSGPCRLATGRTILVAQLQRQGFLSGRKMTSEPGSRLIHYRDMVEKNFPWLGSLAHRVSHSWHQGFLHFHWELRPGGDCRHSGLVLRKGPASRERVA